MNSWSIVQFVKDGTVEAVPSAWLLNGYCYWPSLPPNRLANAIKKCEEINTGWEKHKVKCFINGTFDDYAKARSKAKVAEETSDLQSEAEPPKKRKRQKNKHVSSSDTDDDSNSLISLRLPPTLRIHETLDVCTNNNEIYNRENIPTKSVVINENQETSQLDNNSNTVQKYLKTIIEQQHLLRSIMTDVLSRVEGLEKSLKEHSAPGQKRPSIFKLNILFPINCEQELQKFETHLQDENNFRDAVHELATLGGTNNYNFVKRVMACLMTNKFGTEYSWLGRKGKKMFHSLKLAKIIIDAAEISGVSKNKKETEISIQSWLRRAMERNKVIVKDL
ncbi:uncharacterized protein LOC143211370 isoform X1 [Lasioglossum baleicum]|uniref:uncharacterized protein LOC143211370 isoform X1 n=1 Tax=Lasioglossum baleicum TaxID=434251 RepID=UPI003FCC513D